MTMDLLGGRKVPDDAVHYSLFLIETKDAEDNERILLDLREQILSRFANLLAKYIWQNQPFSLKYQPETGRCSHFTVCLRNVRSGFPSATSGLCL